MMVAWLLLALAVASAEPPSEGLRGLASGRYVLVDPPSVYEPTLDASIEKGLEALPFLFVPLARLRLKPAVYATVCPEITLGLSAERLHVSCGGEQAPFSRRLDGSDGPIIDETGAYQVEITHGDRWVGMRFAGDKGGQSYRYRFPDQGTMVLESSIFSRYLPEDLSWSLRYRRVEE